jgi:hypothetical protein
VTEETPSLGRVPLRKGNALIIVTFFTELFSGFLALGFDQIVKLTVVVIVGDATG